MNTADWLIIILLLALCGGMVMLGARLRPPGTDPNVVDHAPSAPELQTIRTPNGGLAIEIGGSSDPLFELMPLSSTSMDVLSGRSPVRFDPSAAAGPGALLASLISYLPMTEKKTVYLVKFRPEIEAKLAASKARLVLARDGAMAIARGDKGRFAGQGRVVETQMSALSNAQLFSALAVVGVVMYKLDQISEAVEHIEQQLEEIAQRLQDDDHGELRSAEALVEVIMPLLTHGVVPDQLALELAIARQRVDAIYFSRQRFVDRFRLRIVQLQELEEARKGEDARAWARGTTREFSQREALREEALLYARAMVNRAQLAFCTAGVVALQSGTAEAMAVLRHAESELTASFAGLDGLLRELAEERPKWAWVPFNDRKAVHDTARRLAALFTDEVAPLLPRETGRTLEVAVTSDGFERPSMMLDEGGGVTDPGLS
jgi:hypothetical protein